MVTNICIIKKSYLYWSAEIWFCLYVIIVIAITNINEMATTFYFSLFSTQIIYFILLIVNSFLKHLFLVEKVGKLY